jgi:aryl-alcohol dehydrogenase-like predicted oxidoreductase
MSGMRYPRLGPSALRISEITLGTSGAGEVVGEEMFAANVAAALERGIATFDTADAYDDGLAETWLGRAVRSRRDEVVICTKVGLRVGATAIEHGSSWTGPDADAFRRGIGPNDRGLSRKHVISACEASLRRLGTDYIDLYQIHQWDPDAPLDETLGALADLVHAGKVRYIGCSRLAAWQLHQALGRSAVLQLPAFMSMQVAYSLLARQPERELLDACTAGPVGVLAFSVFAGGMLSEEYERGAAPAAGTRLAARPAYVSRYWTSSAFDFVEKVRDLGTRLGRTTAQLALAWVLSRPNVNAAIVGVDRPDHVRALLDVVDHPLTADELAELDALAAGGPDG